MMDNHFPPPYNEMLTCPVCEKIGFDPTQMKHGVLTNLYGVFGGGGPGQYTMCENCGMVLSKSFDSHEEASDVAEDTSPTSDKPV